MKQTKRTRTRKRKPSTIDVSKRPNSPQLLLAILDEMDLIDSLLRTVPILNVAACLVRDEELGGGPDAIAELAKTWFHNDLAQQLQIVNDSDCANARAQLLSAPDAMVETARWRLRRVNVILNALRIDPAKPKRGA